MKYYFALLIRKLWGPKKSNNRHELLGELEYYNGTVYHYVYNDDNETSYCNEIVKFNLRNQSLETYKYENNRTALKYLNIPNEIFVFEQNFKQEYFVD